MSRGFCTSENNTVLFIENKKQEIFSLLEKNYSMFFDHMIFWSYDFLDPYFFQFFWYQVGGNRDENRWKLCPAISQRPIFRYQCYSHVIKGPQRGPFVLNISPLFSIYCLSDRISKFLNQHLNIDSRSIKKFQFSVDHLIDLHVQYFDHLNFPEEY